MNAQSPVNRVPPGVLMIFLIMLVIEVACSFGGLGVVGGPGAVGWRISLVEKLGFSPAVQDLVLRGRAGPELYLRYVSYPLVHGSFTHAAFGLALWLALGKFVAESYRAWAMAVIVLVSIVMGAVMLGLVGAYTNTNPPLFGAYPAIYGLVGAYTYQIWLNLGARGENRMQAFSLIGILVGLQLVFGMLFGADPSWPAELGAFAAGGLTAILVAEGGWTAFVARFRRD